MITQSRVQQRNSEFRIGELFDRNRVQPQRGFVLIIAAAPVDGEIFQTFGVQAKLARFSQQRRKVRGRAKLGSEGGCFQHD